MDDATGRRRHLQFIRPEVKDYGDLVALTADGAAMTHVGFGTLAAVSNPVNPGGGGGGGGGAAPGGDSGGTLGTGGGGGSDGLPSDGGVAGDAATGDGTGSGEDGGILGGKLPFTGFAAAIVGALGAGLSAAGLAARKRLRRD